MSWSSCESSLVGPSSEPTNYCINHILFKFVIFWLFFNLILGGYLDSLSSERFSHYIYFINPCILHLGHVFSYRPSIACSLLISFLVTPFMNSSSVMHTFEFMASASIALHHHKVWGQTGIVPVFFVRSILSLSTKKDNCRHLCTIYFKLLVPLAFQKKRKYLISNIKKKI